MSRTLFAQAQRITVHFPGNCFCKLCKFFPSSGHNSTYLRFADFSPKGSRFARILEKLAGRVHSDAQQRSAFLHVELRRQISETVCTTLSEYLRTAAYFKHYMVDGSWVRMEGLKGNLLYPITLDCEHMASSWQLPHILLVT